MNTGDNNSAKVPYRSFWMGGFEGADHRNSAGLPLDMARASGHLQRLSEDYAAAARLGLGTVRESIGWRLAETAPQTWDLKRAEGMARCAKDHGLQVLWSLMHYGTPPDVSLFDDALIPRFAAFAAEVARKLGPLSDEGPVYSLINEIGFLAWAASETSLIWPYRRPPVSLPAGSAGFG
ncbi:MAG TPA: amine oxidase, partial [Rubrivivax sp.]|nr:amine oxidase [Rubrivivax sp.]